MAYRLFCGIAGSDAEYRTRKPFWSAPQYAELDDALGCALQVLDAHRFGKWQETPWEIEGDDGLRLDRADIAEQLRLRRKELLDRPKVY